MSPTPALYLYCDYVVLRRRAGPLSYSCYDDEYILVIATKNCYELLLRLPTVPTSTREVCPVIEGRTVKQAFVRREAHLLSAYNSTLRSMPVLPVLADARSPTLTLAVIHVTRH